MRVHECLCLALAGLPIGTLGEGLPWASDERDLMENGHSGAFGQGDKHPNHKSECTDWIGVEVIVMVDSIDVCPLDPEDLQGQQTATQCVSTLSRSICATPTLDRPCYPCAFGTPSSSELATVTVTSCTEDTSPTQTVTLQMCCTCSATVYTTTISGYTAGAPCHDCTPYISPSSSSRSESSCITDDDTTTTTTTFTAATTVLAHTETTTTTTFLPASSSESESGCPCAGISTSVSTSTGTSSGYWPTGGTTYTTVYSTTTVGAPYETATEGPPFTGGGMPQGVWGNGGWMGLGLVGWVVGVLLL